MVNQILGVCCNEIYKLAKKKVYLHGWWNFDYFFHLQVKPRKDAVDEMLDGIICCIEYDVTKALVIAFYVMMLLFNVKRCYI